jgi:hypothetical protein
LIAFLAQTKPETVAVASKAEPPANPTATHDALIHATVKACHHRGILSNLCQTLNSQFSRSLLLVWYAHLPFVSKSSLICRFVIDAFAKACSCLINCSIFLSKSFSSGHCVSHKIFSNSALNLGSFLCFLKSSLIFWRITSK